MWVCICHAISDTEVQEAESQGARHPGEVFSHYGVKPQCGRCVTSMKCLMKCSQPCVENTISISSACGSATGTPEFEEIPGDLPKASNF